MYIQEDGFGLEDFAADREAEECSEGVARCEEGDDEDGENG